jgi:hypothetical protein
VSGAPSWIRLAAGSVILWIGAFFCLLGALFFVVGAQEAVTDYLFARDSQATEASLIGKTVQPAESGLNSTTRYVIHYRFAAADGALIERYETVPVEMWESVKPGGSFSVRYVPGEPARSRAATTTDWPFALIFMALGGIFCAVGGPLAYFGGKETTRQWRLWRTGVGAAATVTGIAASSTTVNNMRQMQILYRYKDALGVEHEGSSAPMSAENAFAWSKGDHGSVRYDQQDADSSIWTGKA